MKVPLRNIKNEIVDYALINAMDWPKIMHHRWGRDAHGYAVSAWYEDGKLRNVKMHRFIMDAAPGTEIDHINRNRLDNRRDNLRFCTRSENNRNSKLRVDNPSGERHVGWDRARRRWKVQIRHDGRNQSIGRFISLSEAVAARDKALLTLA